MFSLFKVVTKKFEFISGKYADYLRDNIKEINEEYDFKLSLKKDCVELNVVAGKFLTNVGDLKKDSKYKIFLKTDVEV